MLITVKGARVTAKIPQSVAAEKLGLSLTGYSRKENGKSKFYADEIMILGNLFGIKPEFFYESQCRKKTQKERVEREKK